MEPNPQITSIDTWQLESHLPDSNIYCPTKKVLSQEAESFHWSTNQHVCWTPARLTWDKERVGGCMSFLTLWILYNSPSPTKPAIYSYCKKLWNLCCGNGLMWTQHTHGAWYLNILNVLLPLHLVFILPVISFAKICLWHILSFPSGLC